MHFYVSACENSNFVSEFGCEGGTIEAERVENRRTKADKTEQLQKGEKEIPEVNFPPICLLA